MSEKTNIIYEQDPEYPQLLKQINKPPEKLYYQGDLSLLSRPCLSVVGTRRSSDYGEYLTEKIIQELAPYKVVIVSGLAKGIDTFAHKLALKYGLKTIAVLGSGLSNIYPRPNTALAKKIGEKGLLLSEYAPETEVQQFFFPQRNRIISGITLGTLVIEAPEKSGAMITARYALDQGREIFTIPGDIDRINSLGALQLLQRHGAYPIASGREIIEILSKQSSLPFPEPARLSADTINSNGPFDPAISQPLPEKPKSALSLLSKERQAVLNSLGRGRGRSLEELQVKTKISFMELLPMLSFMEIEDLIFSRAGRYFRANAM